MYSVLILLNGICLSARMCLKHIHYMGMLKCIQEQVPLMWQLTAQLRSSSLCYYAVLQCNTNTEALTSLLHHHHYITSCQTLKNISLTSNCCFASHSDFLRGLRIEQWSLFYFLHSMTTIKMLAVQESTLLEMIGKQAVDIIK